MERGESFVSLAITDFGDDPSVVTELVGMAPTKCWSKGDPWNEGAVRYGSAWVLETPAPHSASTERRLEELLTMLEKQENGFIEAGRRFHSQVSIAAYFTESTPEMYLHRSLVARIARLECSIDVATYHLED